MTGVVGFLAQGAACIAADGAVWGADGRVQSLEQKLIPIPAAQTVIVGTGVFSRGRLAMFAGKCRDLSQLQDYLVRFAETNRDRVRAEDEWRDLADQAELTIWAASWWKGKPVLWGISKDYGGDYEPKELGALRLSPDIDWSAACGRSIVTREDVAAMDPARDAAAIMEAQRQIPHEFSFGTLYPVGGWCDVATVTADAISIERVCTWPDQVGERIQPLTRSAGQSACMPGTQKR